MTVRGRLRYDIVARSFRRFSSYFRLSESIISTSIKSKNQTTFSIT